MVARHPNLSVEELAARAASVGMADEVHVTTSGKPMLEISAKAVSYTHLTLPTILLV